MENKEQIIKKGFKQMKEFKKMLKKLKEHNIKKKFEIYKDYFDDDYVEWLENGLTLETDLSIDEKKQFIEYIDDEVQQTQKKGEK